MATIVNVVRWADNTAELSKNLKEGLNQIEATKAGAEKLVQSLSGDRLLAAAHKYAAAVQEIGGAARLTVAEQSRVNDVVTRALEKYKALGQTAPQALHDLAAATKGAADSGGGFNSMLGKASGLLGAFGIGLSVSAVVGFGKQLLADADALEKMSDRTGISVEWLQKFQVAGDDAGNTVEDMSGAINQMQNRMASGDKSFNAALEKLDIDLQHFKSLRPEQQFVAISDALRQIEDPAEQVALAMDVFGKQGANVLPTLKRGFDDVRNSAVGMSEDTVQALDEAGDALARWWRSGKAIVADAAVEYARLAASGFNYAYVEAANLDRQLAALNKQVKTNQEQAAKGLHGFTNAPLGAVPVPEGADLRKIDRDLDAELAKQKQARKDAEEAAKAEARALDDVIAGFRNYKAVGVDAAHAVALGFGGGLNVLRDIAIETGQITVHFNEGIDALKNLKDVGIPKLPTIDQIIADQRGNPLAGLGPQPDLGIPKLVMPGILHGFDQMFREQVPQVITAAIAGGGDPLEAAGSLIGAQLGKNLGDSLAKPLTNIFGKTIGGALAAALPGIGAMLGPALGALIDKLNIGGPSKKELAGRSLEADFEKQFSSFEDMAGKLAEAYEQTGRSAEEARIDLQGLLDAERQGPEATQRWLDKINAVLDQQRAVASATDDLADAFGEAGEYIPASMRASIESLLRMNGLTDDEKTKLQELLDASQPTFASMTQTAEQYGITLAGLGPKFEQGALEESAKQIYDDFVLLTDAGADVGGVLAGMGDEISKLVQDSLKFGTAIPDNMKPLIENLAAAGQLLDENGDKITDMSGIKFEGTPLDKGLDKLNKAIDHFASVLEGLPSNKTFEYHTKYTEEGERPPTEGPTSGPAMPPGDDNAAANAYTGGRVTGTGLQHFAIGGFVRAARFPQARGFDSVPILASPGELIFNLPQQQRLADLLHAAQATAADLARTPAAGGAPITVQVNNEWHFEGYITEETVQRQIIPVIHQTWDDIGALRQRAQEILGVV